MVHTRQTVDKNKTNVIVLGMNNELWVGLITSELNPCLKMSSRSMTVNQLMMYRSPTTTQHELTVIILLHRRVYNCLSHTWRPIVFIQPGVQDMYIIDCAFKLLVD